MDKNMLHKNSDKIVRFYKGKSVMVAGGTGMLGSSVVRYLRYLNEFYDGNISIYVLYRNEEKKNLVYRDVTNDTHLHYIKCEIDTPLLIAEDIDYIVDCAGLSGGSKMHLKEPVKVFDINLCGTRHLLDFAAEHRCKGFFYVSTYEIYGDASQEEYIREDQPCSLDTFVLRNSYAEIKRVCESMLCAFSTKYGFKVNSARLTSTFGQGVEYNDPRFFSEFGRCIIENKNIVLKSTGATVRSYLDADDAAIAFLYIMAFGENCSAYNLTNMNNEISIRALAQKMIDICGSEIRIVFEIEEDVSKTGMRREGITVMDTSKLQGLGWNPVYQLEDTIMKLMSSMKESKRGKKWKSIKRVLR